MYDPADHTSYDALESEWTLLVQDVLIIPLCRLNCLAFVQYIILSTGIDIQDKKILSTGIDIQNNRLKELLNNEPTSIISILTCKLNCHPVHQSQH